MDQLKLPIPVFDVTGTYPYFSVSIVKAKRFAQSKGTSNVAPG